MIGKISRILLEEYQNVDEFIEDVTENVSRDVLELLLEYPLYRGMTVGSLKKYGKRKISLDRKPLSNSPIFHHMLEHLLKDKGYCARRSNSIFATGDREFARNFGSLCVIFPPKGFCFTWNKLVKDMTLDNVIYAGGEFQIDLDLEKGFELFGKKFAEYLLRILTASIKSGPEKEFVDELWIEVVERDKLTEKEQQLFKNLWSIIERDRVTFEHIVKILFIKIQNLDTVAVELGEPRKFPPEKAVEVFKIKKDGKFARSFDDSDIKSAIFSGNEIMIHAPYYFFVTEGAFNKYMKDALKQAL